MANQDYFWFDVSPDSIGKVGMRYITQQDIKLTLAKFIINPYNRTILSKIPNMIRDIEENTHDDFTGDERQAWSNAKMKQFQTFIRNAYDSLMEEDIQSLVNTHAKDWHGLEDFIGQWIDKGEIVHQGLGPEWKLKHMLGKNSRRDFIGYQYKIGRTDLSAKQKKLSDNKRKFTSDEFFGFNPKEDGVLSYIDVDFQKASDAPKNKMGFIKVKFKVNHSNGKVPRRIFEEAGFSKIVIKDDPAGFGGSIREGNYSQGWNYSTDNTASSKFDSKETAGMFGVSDSTKWQFIDSDAVWSGADDKISDTKREARKTTERRAIGPIKQKIQDKIDGILYSTRGGKQKARNRINRDKRIPELQKKKMINEINKRTYKGKILTQKEADKLIAPLKEELANVGYREGRKEQGALRDKKQKAALKEQYTFEIRNNADLDKLEEIFNRAYDPKSAADVGAMQATHFYDEDGMKNLIEDWMESGELYEDYLDKVMPIGVKSPWRLLEINIELTFKAENISGNKIMIESKGIVKGKKMISKEALLKPTTMRSKKAVDSSYIQLPVRTNRQNKYAGSVKDTDKDKGVNEARMFLAKRMKGNIIDIVEAAKEIGLNLKVNFPDESPEE